MIDNKKYKYRIYIYLLLSAKSPKSKFIYPILYTDYIMLQSDFKQVGIVNFLWSTEQKSFGYKIINFLKIFKTKFKTTFKLNITIQKKLNKISHTGIKGIRKNSYRKKQIKQTKQIDTLHYF